MTTISVTRALAQIKSLEGRISDAVQKPFISITVGGKPINGVPVQQAETDMRGNLQSVKDLIAQRNSIKAAVVKSNAVTSVIIANKAMTVAEAIERKSGIRFEQALLENLRRQHGLTIQHVDRTNKEVQTRLDALVTQAVGKDRKVDEAEIEAIAKPFRSQNEATLVNPNGLETQIKALQDEIDAFLLEVDYALSEVNATTQIEV
tara:strand:- start:424 stop:1038 length:615 start_codon:yes stop_codon:yes gene_type:complete